MLAISLSAQGSVYGGVLTAHAASSTLGERPSEPKIFFDKSIYYPPARIFWDQSASLISIRITVEDRYVASDLVRVKVSSSLEAEKVTLARVGPGRFEGTTVAKCLRLDEPPSSAVIFNVRFGDTIVARYAGQVQITALIAFPRYVLANFCDSVDSWRLFDSEGVPLVDYGPPTGIQYNPVGVCHYGLANYHMYLATENVAFREKFLVQANWLVRNAVQREGFAVWEYNFDWPFYNCTDPWVSAMAQGEGLSVLTRAYVLAGDIKYLEVARAAMWSFRFEMTSGGVRYTNSDSVWFEEYADTEAPSSKVLNGFIFSLFGLFEYSFETDSDEGYELFWEGARSLSLNLYQYDTGSWSYYDLLHLIEAHVLYHTLHINQLLTLYWLSGDQQFRAYSDLFKSYLL